MWIHRRYGVHFPCYILKIKCEFLCEFVSHLVLLSYVLHRSVLKASRLKNSVFFFSPIFEKTLLKYLSKRYQREDK